VGHHLSAIESATVDIADTRFVPERLAHQVAVVTSHFVAALWEQASGRHVSWASGHSAYETNWARVDDACLVVVQASRAHLVFRCLRPRFEATSCLASLQANQLRGCQLNAKAPRRKRSFGQQRVLRVATEVLGSKTEALRWLESPAMALDQRLPIDLIATRDGEALVRTLLNRIEYCVYTVSLSGGPVKLAG
jgi:hypothetical protein